MAAFPACPTNHVRLSPAVKLCLSLWKHFLLTRAEHPTHYEEIFPRKPQFFGAHDACLSGMGGVFFLPNGRAFVWSVALPPPLRNIHHINTLELAAHVGHLLLRARFLQPLDHTLDGVDNLATLHWLTKGSTSRHDVTTNFLAAKGLLLQDSHVISSQPTSPESSTSWQMTRPVWPTFPSLTFCTILTIPIRRRNPGSLPRTYQTSRPG